MGATYDVIGSRTQDELQGGTRLIRVRVVELETKFNRIYWEERFPLGEQTPASMAQYLALQGGLIDTIADDPRVVAMVYEQDVNVGGQLVDIFEITVQSTSTRSTASFNQPYSDLSLQVIDPKLDAQVALLDQIEGL